MPIIGAAAGGGVVLLVVIVVLVVVVRRRRGAGPQKPRSVVPDHGVTAMFSNPAYEASTSGSDASALTTQNVLYESSDGSVAHSQTANDLYSAPLTSTTAAAAKEGGAGGRERDEPSYAQPHAPPRTEVDFFMEPNVMYASGANNNSSNTDARGGRGRLLASNPAHGGRGYATAAVAVGGGDADGDYEDANIVSPEYMAVVQDDGGSGSRGRGRQVHESGA